MKNFTDSLRDASMPVIMAFSILPVSGQAVAQTLTREDIAKIKEEVGGKDICQVIIPAHPADKSTSITVACAYNTTMALHNIVNDMAKSAGFTGRQPEKLQFWQEQSPKQWQQTEMKATFFTELAEQFAKRGIASDRIVIKSEETPGFVIWKKPGEDGKIILSTKFITTTPPEKIAEIVTRTLARDHAGPRPRTI